MKNVSPIEMIRPKDRISQRELQELAELEMVAWKSLASIQRALVRVGDRIAAGADVEPGPLYYAEEIGAVLYQSSPGSRATNLLDLLPSTLAETVMPPPRRQKA